MAFQTPTLVQQNATASTTAAPASFTANFGANTTAGTTLFALVATANNGTVATVNAPTGWPATSYGQGGNGQTSISLKCFAFPNNGGGFTAVAFTGLANDNAIAVALFEFSGMPLTTNQDPIATLNANVWNVSTSASSRSVTATPQLGNEVWLGLLACDALQTITAVQAPTGTGIGAWQTGSSATSTTGATNIKISSYYSIPGPSFPTGGVLTNGLTIGAASFIGAGLIAFGSLSTSALSQDAAGNPGGAMSWSGSGAGQAVGV